MWGVTDTQGLISKGRLTYSWLVMWGVTDTQCLISKGRPTWVSVTWLWFFK